MGEKMLLPLAKRFSPFHV